jgi:cyanophycinase-like exopeptidase
VHLSKLALALCGLLLAACATAPRQPPFELSFAGELLAPETPVRLRVTGLEPGAAYRLEIRDRYQPGPGGTESASTRTRLFRPDGSLAEGYAGTHDGLWYADDPGGIVVKAADSELLVAVETGRKDGTGSFSLRMSRAGADELARASRSLAVREGVPSFRQGIAEPSRRPLAGGLFLHGSSVVSAARNLQGEASGGGEGIFLTAEEGRISLMAGVSLTEGLAVDSPERAGSPYAARRLGEASSIFMDGGDQSVYVRAWKDSGLAAAINAAVRGRRVPIGGNSAGLAVMGEFSYAALHGHDLVAAEALADPFNPWMTLETDFLRLPGLEGAITETHYAERGRQGRLVAFLARLLADGRGRLGALYGIGVDEGSCLAIDGEGRARVFGTGSAWILVPQSRPEACSPGKPLGWEGRAVKAIRLPGTATGAQSWDWSTIRELPATTWYGVEAGRLRESP